MYRPWWFPEYTPSEQRIFDTIVSILTKHFEKWNYQHIMTPAVEPVDILTRWWDIGDKQVYGLYGLAQGNEDTKDYALHFDLTVPFARYVLDHMNDLVFPFKRYQMQPVWRWERTKRGRYKEFWQFDIDTIWRTETDVGSRYDAESIIVSYQALKDIFAETGIDTSIVVKVSNIWVTKAFLSSLGIIDNNQLAICKLLDDYFKMSHETFMSKASAFADATALQKIEQLLTSHDYTLVADIEWYNHLATTITSIQSFWVNVQYDLAIIRWHNYYTWTVVEFFLEDDIELWAIAWWWAYRGLTDFIDAKRSFSGVWCSISSRIMEVILSKWWKLKQTSETYLVTHFTDTKDASMDIVRYLHAGGKHAELYPTAAKLGKQFEYADKKWLSHVIVYWESEKNRGVVVVKDLQLWTEKECTRSYTAWCIVVHDRKVLIVKAPQWHWSFPKWHLEAWESIEKAAYRELAEETWITDISLLSERPLSLSYFLDSVAEWKVIDFFLVEANKSDVAMQAWEVVDYKRATSKEAKKLLHPVNYNILTWLKKYID